MMIINSHLKTNILISFSKYTLKLLISIQDDNIW